MKIAIHHRLGSFSERWIEYCKEKNIDFKIVNAFDNDIIEQVKDCNAFMWHHHHAHFKDVLTAKRILFALEQAGIKVFPNFNTGWHFDDKVAQKYLLEAIGAPLVPSYVFYDKREALEWAKETTYPKVWKLKGGAGAANVKLVKSQNDAQRYIKKAFGKGFSQFDGFGGFKERVRKYKQGQDSLIGVAKGFVRMFIPTDFAKQHGRDRGYIYFQEFIPKNRFDIRVIIVDGKAFAIKRMVRENDFRASGSGNIIYDKDQIDDRCISISFKANNKIKSQSIAFDYIFDKDNNPLIVELSYGFATEAYDACPGYWDSNISWHEGKFNPQEWMVDYLVNRF